MFNTPPTPYDLSFRFLGFSVRVQPLFWIVFLFLGLNFNGSIKDGDLMPWLVNLVLWIAAVFVSILVHELGHALVFRHVFHVPSSITLHGFGGVTAPYYQHQRKYGFSGLCREVFLNAAGALAEFFLAAVFLFFLAALHHTGTFDMHDRELFSDETSPLSLLVTFMSLTAAISIFWGVFNLLPIYPMDGGQIAREVFTYCSPSRGVANSLVLSMACAVILAVLAFQAGSIFIVILFAYFAYQNYLELTFRRF